MDKSNDLSSFEIFPDLPKEIRLKIWREDLQTPTLVIVTRDNKFYPPTIHKKLSPLLATNQESRAEALLLQKPVFCRDIPHTQCLIDVDLDTLFIERTFCASDCGCLALISTLSDTVHSQLKHLAVSARMWENLAQERNWRVIQPLRVLRNLEKITIIVSVKASRPGSVTYSSVDSALDIRHRTTRKLEIGEKTTDAMEEFLKISQRDPNWKVPSLEYKIRLTLSKMLLGMEEYYAEGFLPRTYDGGWVPAEGDQHWFE